MRQRLQRILLTYLLKLLLVITCILGDWWPLTSYAGPLKNKKKTVAEKRPVFQPEQREKVVHTNTSKPSAPFVQPSATRLSYFSASFMYSAHLFFFSASFWAAECDAGVISRGFAKFVVLRCHGTVILRNHNNRLMC